MKNLILIVLAGFSSSIASAAISETSYLKFNLTASGFTGMDLYYSEKGSDADDKKLVAQLNCGKQILKTISPWDLSGDLRDANAITENTVMNDQDCQKLYKLLQSHPFNANTPYGASMTFKLKITDGAVMGIEKDLN